MSNLCSKCKVFLTERKYICEACESLIFKEECYIQWRDWFRNVWETDAQIIECEWKNGIPVEYNYDKACIMESWWQN